MAQSSQARHWSERLRQRVNSFTRMSADLKAGNICLEMKHDESVVMSPTQRKLSAEAMEDVRLRATLRAQKRILVIVLLLPAGYALTLGLPIEIRAALLAIWGVLFLLVTAKAAFPMLQLSGEKFSIQSEDAIRALAEEDNPENIGILIDAEAVAWAESRQAIQTALTRLLPAASVGLAGEHLELLYTHLNVFARLTAYTTTPMTWSAYPLGGAWERTKVISEEFPELREKYIDFLVAILAGLENFGTADSVRYVEALANGEPKTAQADRIQQAAWQCLDAIHERLEAERLGRTLLRSASEPIDALLRPATHTAANAPESLLRSNAPDDDDQNVTDSSG